MTYSLVIRTVTQVLNSPKMVSIMLPGARAHGQGPQSHVYRPEGRDLNARDVRVILTFCATCGNGAAFVLLNI